MALVRRGSCRREQAVTDWLSADSPLLERRGDLAFARDALRQVSDADLESTQTRMLALLQERPQPFDRGERPGHFTGSALVVDSTATCTLVMLHSKLGIWVQPGGHADGDTNLAGVALREAGEETGITGLRVWPLAVDLDIHRVNPPGEDAHDHHDVRFLVVAPRDARVEANHESRELRWVEPSQLSALGVDEGLKRLVSRGFVLANSQKVKRRRGSGSCPCR